MTKSDRDAILGRRARFVTRALAAAGIATAAAQGCGGESTSDGGGSLTDAQADNEPQPCLGVALDAGSDAAPDADAEPRPCLEPPLDAGVDATDDADAEPQPCLAPPP
ncbi:MAG: hypothetical protein H6806_13615 [Planctomycetes bacterium]|nr:hypothetical protein [Myxococcales bacterium]MCB9577648.1 hypothetical protein [Polyangiaceae bacterium]MCB9830782.1 hypothetical protein [Planctomycetota bacterium]